MEDNQDPKKAKAAALAAAAKAAAKAAAEANAAAAAAAKELEEEGGLGLPKSQHGADLHKTLTEVVNFLNGGGVPLPAAAPAAAVDKDAVASLAGELKKLRTAVNERLDAVEEMLQHKADKPD